MALDTLLRVNPRGHVYHPTLGLRVINTNQESSSLNQICVFCLRSSVYRPQVTLRFDGLRVRAKIWDSEFILIIILLVGFRRKSFVMRFSMASLCMALDTLLRVNSRP